MSLNKGNTELALNLWAYLDQGIGLVYALSGKAYALIGTEEEKLALLHQLATTDHLTVKRQRVPQNFRVTDGEQTKEGYVAPSTLQGTVAQAFEGVLKSLEAELPPIPNFQTDQHTPQRIPHAFLFVLTFLLEDHVGNVTPITTREQSRELSVETQKRELMGWLGLSEQEAEEMARQWARNETGDIDSNDQM
jgi:hypothetical protein